MRETSVPGLRRGFDILQCFSEDHTELSVKEIADAVRVPLASSYRIIGELRAIGALEPVTGANFDSESLSLDPRS